jgi:hypothetical protein
MEVAGSYCVALSFQDRQHDLTVHRVRRPVCGRFQLALGSCPATLLCVPQQWFCLGVVCWSKG